MGWIAKFVLTDVKVKDSDGKEYFITIVAKSAAKMPCLDYIPQTDAGEREFWQNQMGKRLSCGIFKPASSDVYYAVGAKIV